jgi:hypothetical protein
MKAMREVDVSRADSFYSATQPRVLQTRKITEKEMKPEKRIQLDETFYDLMNMGFERRLTDTYSPEKAFMHSSAKKVFFEMELGKSKTEQLVELKKTKLENRSGFVKLFPESLHKYFDYMNSMYVKPKDSDFRSNLLLGAFFSIVLLANRVLRSCFMYANVAQLMLISTMLTRNIPEVPVQPGMGRRRVATWSGNAFRTAVAINLFYFWSTAAIVGSVLSILPLSVYIRAKTALVAGVLSTSYFTSFYEVYEEKGKGGWRWQRAMEGTSISDVDAIIEKNSKDKKISDTYDYHYDPMVNEFPPQQIYIDEVPGEPLPAAAAGDMDENEWVDHYQNWRNERKDSRRAPVTDVAPETPWVGGKVGMYVSKVPGWIGNAYKKSTQSMNKWRGKVPKHVKDTSEFEPIHGPLGFRDRRPDWMELFGSGVWEETGAASRSAARAYGTYRKCMWKIDKKVVLQKCDE